MKKIAWFGLTALLAVAAGAAEVVKLEADLPALAGKTRAQLSRIFPGKENTLQRWNEWSQVTLDFRTNGQVDNISFKPKKPISERKAGDLLASKLNVKLDGAVRRTNKAGVRYMMPSGAVERVNMIFGETSDIGDLLSNSGKAGGVVFSEIDVMYAKP